jgi:excisionase family DNA binding protein
MQQHNSRKFTMAHETYETAKTLSVPEAGKRYLGLSRGAAYRAAAAGTIPAIRVGRLLKVPVASMERLLENAGNRGGK